MPNIQKYTKMQKEKEKIDKIKKPVTSFKHDADKDVKHQFKPKRTVSPIKLPAPGAEKEGEQRLPNQTPFEKSESGEPIQAFDPKFVSTIEGLPTSPV